MIINSIILLIGFGLWGWGAYLARKSANESLIKVFTIALSGYTMILVAGMRIVEML